MSTGSNRTDIASSNTEPTTHRESEPTIHRRESYFDVLKRRVDERNAASSVQQSPDSQQIKSVDCDESSSCNSELCKNTATIFQSSTNVTVEIDGRIESAPLPAPETDSINEIELDVTNSNLSAGSIACRICYEGSKKGKLISPCKCTGTMGYLHRSCIEKWLGSSNSNKCEICKFEYITVRQPKPLKEWICQPSRRSDRRNLCGDFTCFLLLTPLAAISVWLCTTGAMTYAYSYDNGKWEAIGLLTLAIFLLIIYLVWCGVATRYHYGVYKHWSQHNQNVRVIGLDQLSASSNTSSEETIEDGHSPQVTS